MDARKCNRRQKIEETTKNGTRTHLELLASLFFACLRKPVLEQFSNGTIRFGRATRGGKAHQSGTNVANGRSAEHTQHFARRPSVVGDADDVRNLIAVAVKFFYYRVEGTATAEHCDLRAQRKVHSSSAPAPRGCLEPGGCLERAAAGATTRTGAANRHLVRHCIERRYATATLGRQAGT